MTNLTVIDHPLITHHLAIMRDTKTPAHEFRQRLHHICQLMFYRATEGLPQKSTRVTTPLEHMETDIIDCDLTFVPILRAGLGMQEPLLQMYPEAAVGTLGFYRNEETLEPVQYYYNLPSDISNSVTFLLDPMLATGGSLNAAISVLKDNGAQDVRCITLLSAKDGIDLVSKNHPDTPIFTAAVDRALNDKGYILPGLGDAGDRMYGT